jgi:hypothetical protein
VEDPAQITRGLVESVVDVAAEDGLRASRCRDAQERVGAAQHAERPALAEGPSHRRVVDDDQPAQVAEGGIAQRDLQAAQLFVLDASGRDHRPAPRLRSLQEQKRRFVPEAAYAQAVRGRKGLLGEVLLEETVWL